MKKTHAKFQNDQYKLVREVPLTRGTHYLYIEGEKWLSHNVDKMTKKDRIINPNHMHILIPWKKHMQSFKTISTKL